MSILIIASENVIAMEYSNIWNKSKSSTFEKENLDDDDSEIEDFCLVFLFEDIEDIPEKELISSSDSDSGSLDSVIGCLTLPQPDDNILQYENSENSEFYLLIRKYLIIMTIFFICYMIGVTVLIITYHFM